MPRTYYSKGHRPKQVTNQELPNHKLVSTHYKHLQSKDKIKLGKVEKFKYRDKIFAYIETMFYNTVDFLNCLILRCLNNVSIHLGRKANRLLYETSIN